MNNRSEAILTLNLFFIKNEKDYFDLNGEDYAYKVYIDTLSLKYFSKKQNISIEKNWNFLPFKRQTVRFEVNIYHRIECIYSFALETWGKGWSSQGKPWLDRKNLNTTLICI